MPGSDALLALSSVELRRLIGTKEISPVELLELCIERIAHINPAVNAITATCYERARKEAQAAETAVLKGEPLGILHMTIYTKRLKALDVREISGPEAGRVRMRSLRWPGRTAI